MIDAIFISNLFPNPAEPGRGLYNRDQMVALAHQGLKFHVISPLPWFPFVNPWKQAIPRHTTMDGIPVTYCRQLYLPGSRGAQNGYLYALSIRRTLSRLIRQHHPTFLWSSFAFPDGVGVAVEARRHGIPHVTSLLGSDINLNHHYPSRWKTITKSLRQACLIFAKSKALRERVEDSFPPSALPLPPPPPSTSTTTGSIRISSVPLAVREPADSWDWIPRPNTSSSLGTLSLSRMSLR